MFGYYCSHIFYATMLSLTKPLFMTVYARGANHTFSHILKRLSWQAIYSGNVVKPYITWFYMLLSVCNLWTFSPATVFLFSSWLQQTHWHFSSFNSLLHHIFQTCQDNSSVYGHLFFMNCWKGLRNDCAQSSLCWALTGGFSGHGDTSRPQLYTWHHRYLLIERLYAAIININIQYLAPLRTDWHKEAVSDSKVSQWMGKKSIVSKAEQ